MTGISPEFSSRFATSRFRRFRPADMRARSVIANSHTQAKAAGAVEGQLATCTLCYGADRRGLERRIELEARSAAVAPEIAQARRTDARRFCFGAARVLCRREREGQGPGSLWIIAPKLR